MSFIGKIKSAAGGALLGFRMAFGSYSEAAGFSPDRGAVYLHLGGDTRQPADAYTRRRILEKVTWLFQNFGIIKEACRGMARHTVGKGICLSLNTDDDEWNALAEADFEAWAMAPDRCDLAGRRNFYELQNFAVFQRVKQGGFLAAFVQNPRWGGEPCLQVFDALELDTPSEHAGNANIIDGVELDQHHCPVKYWIRGLGGNYTPYPRSEFIHWYHADEANQVREISEFAQAVAPLQDVRELVRLTSKTAKQNAAIGLHIKKMVKHGGPGAIDKIRTMKQRFNVANGADPGSNKPDGSGDNAPAYERLAGGGAIIYTDEGGEAKFLTPNSPTPLLEPFIRNVLMRDGLSSIGGGGADFFWALADVNAAGQRAILVKQDLVFVVMGDGVIGHVCNPAAVRLLNDRISKGKLRRPMRRVLKVPQITPGQAVSAEESEPVETWEEDVDGHWMSCLAWQLPARISIDNSRDAAAEISQLQNNVETLSTIHDRRGRGWRGMVDQWFRECAYASRSAKRNGAEWALKLWRAGVPGAQGGDIAGGDAQQDTTDRVDRLEKQQKDQPKQEPKPDPNK
jgi:capsid protein